MNATRSPLGDFGELPGEIRNEIYRFAFTTPHPIEISRYRYTRYRSDTIRKPGKAITYTSRNTDYGPRSKTLIWRGKQKRKLPAAEVLSISLLRTSKDINRETNSLFYGLNTFDFANEHAVAAFMHVIGKQAALLTRVAFPSTLGELRLELFNRMADLKRVEVRVSSLVSAKASAAYVWEPLKTIVSTQSRFGVSDSNEEKKVLIALPAEMQLKRFEAVHFVVDRDTRFPAGGEGVTWEVIEDDGERGRRYRALVREVMVQEIETEITDMEKDEQDLPEKLRSSREMRGLLG